MVWGLLLIGLVAFVLIGSLLGFIASGSVRKLKAIVEKLLWTVSQLQNRLDEAEENLRSEGPEFAPKEAATDSLAELEQLVEEAPAAEPPPALPAQSYVPPVPETIPLVVPDSAHLIADPPEPAEAPPPEPETPILPSPPAQADSKQSAPRPLQAFLKRIGPKDSDMPWEMALGTYWLPRLGAIALSIAIVFLLTLAIQKWGPPVRVMMGYGVAAVLLGIGLHLDRKFPNYARVLFGAGFALLYFVTFATHFVPFAKLFETPTISLSGLCVIVVAWVGLAVRRNSRITGAIATLLGHLTIGLATFTLTYPTLYSVLGVVMLNFGSAFFLFRMRWYLIAALGMLACYVNNFLLMTRSEISGTVPEFTVSMTVLAVSFLIFSIVERVASKRIRDSGIPSWVRNCFVIANTGGLLVLGSMVMDDYGFSAGDHHIFRYAVAGVLLLIGMTYLRAGARDPLYNTYLTKAVTVATLGLAVQFDAHTLTAWLAVEMLVLLVLARQSGLVVTRVLAFLVGAVAFLQGVASIQASDFVSYSSPGYAVQVAQSLGLIVAFLAASRFYQSVDWSSRSPRTLNLKDYVYQSGKHITDLVSLAKGSGIPPTIGKQEFKEGVCVGLWKLDLLAELPAGREGETKPFHGLLFPHLYAMAAVALAIYGYIPNLTALGDRALSLVVAAAILAIVARWLQSASFGLGSTLVAVSAFFPWGIGELMNQEISGYGDLNHRPAAIKTISTLVVFLFLSEFVRRTEKRFEPRGLRMFPAGFTATHSRGGDSHWSDEGRTINLLPFFLAAGAILLFAGWMGPLVEEGHRWVVFSALTVLAVLPALSLGALQLGFASILALIFATFAGTVELLSGPGQTLPWPSLILLGVTAFLSERRFLGDREGLRIHQGENSPYFLYGLVAWLLGLTFVRTYQPSAEVLSLLLSAVAAALLALILHRNALAICSLFLLLWSQAMWHLGFATDNVTMFRPLAWGILAALIAGDRYFTVLKVTRIRPAFLIAAWLLVLSYIFLEASADWIAFWWSVSAVAFLSYGIVCRTRTPALLALLSTVCASLFHTVHALNETMPVEAVVAGFAGPIVMWLVLERSVSFLESRFGFTLPWRPSPVFVGLASGLAVLMLSNIPSLSEFYLTIGWSVLGLILFGFALSFREKMYRYAGLLVLLLASIRVIAVDTRELETLPKVFAWGVLGAVLIALGFGYVKAVAGRAGKEEMRTSDIE